MEFEPRSEREALQNMLDAQRIGLIRKIEDVSDELARGVLLETRSLSSRRVLTTPPARVSDPLAAPRRKKFYDPTPQKPGPLIAHRRLLPARSD